MSLLPSCCDLHTSNSALPLCAAGEREMRHRTTWSPGSSGQRPATLLSVGDWFAELNALDAPTATAAMNGQYEAPGPPSPALLEPGQLGKGCVPVSEGPCDGAPHLDAPQFAGSRW